MEYSDRQKWEPHIRATLSQLGEDIGAHVRYLARDWLFPAFKTPMDELTRERIAAEIERQTDYPAFAEPMELMVTRDEALARELAVFCRQSLLNYLYLCSLYQVRATINENPHWGHTLFASQSQPGAWPIGMQLLPASPGSADQQARPQGVMDHREPTRR